MLPISNRVNVLGLKIVSHDTGAALIADGRIVAIAEERLNRIKHSHNIFPKLSIDYCLGTLGVKPEDIDLIAIDQIGSRENFPVKDIFLKKMGNTFPRAQIQVVNHHDAHAASAFFCSPFQEAAILIHDGAGEEFDTHFGVPGIETETLYYGSGGCFDQIQKTTHFGRGKRFHYTFGVGKLYTLLSQNYIGFGHFNEGKMMGLAPYGTDALIKRFPLKDWFKEVGGHIICNPRITFPLPGKRSIEKRIKSNVGNFRYIIQRGRDFILRSLGYARKTFGESGLGFS